VTTVTGTFVLLPSPNFKNGVCLITFESVEANEKCVLGGHGLLLIPFPQRWQVTLKRAEVRVGLCLLRRIDGRNGDVRTSV
jgi:hypothetical protein